MKHLLWLFLAAFAPATALGQYAITTGSLPAGTVNQDYSAQIQTNSNLTATACTVVSGALPAGLNIQPVGPGCTILGVPSSGGIAAFSLTVSNVQGQITSPRLLSVSVFGIVTLALPTAGLNSNYNFQVQGNGGTGQYQWSLVSGSLPAGLSLSSSGLISGTPQTVGLSSFSLRLLDVGSGSTDVRDLTLSVTDSGTIPGVFQLISSALPVAVLNQSYTAAIQTSGAVGNLSTVNGCTVIQGSVPPGMSIGPVGTACVVSGAGLAPGNFQFQLRATDSQGFVTPAAAFSITVGAGGGTSGGTLNITTSQIPNGTTASAYLPNGAVFSFTATGGSGAYAWQLQSGSLPAGLTLGSNGTLTGTPRQAGSFNFTVRATSGPVLTTPGQSGTRSFVMTINSGGLIIVETSLPPANTGQPFSFQLHASGGNGPYRWALGPNELPGFSIDFVSGTITGTPQTAGTFSLPVTVSGGGAQWTQMFSLIATAPFTIVTTSLPDVSAPSGYSHTLQATGGQSPYAWSLLSGSLPPGMFLTSTGTVGGAPSANGLYIFTVLATDQAARTATKTLTLQVGPPSSIVILTASLPDGAIGTQYSQALGASGGQADYSWTVVGGSLPPGLTLASNGVLQGTPTQGGVFSFSVRAADSIGNSTARSLTLTIVSGRLSLAPSQLSFSFALGGGQPLPQQVGVSSSSATSFSVTTNVAWLSVSPVGGTTPATLSVSANPAVLPAAAGVHNGNVIITPLGVSDPPQIIPVSLVISAASGLTVNPSALTFTYQVNGALPLAQFLSLGGSGAALTFTAFSNTGWLSVNPFSGVTPTTLSVSVNPGGLAVGTHTGTINIVGGGGSRQVPVTLTVGGTTPAPAVTLSRTSLAFTYQLNGALPGTQFANLLSVVPVSFSAVSDSPWLSVITNVGTTPAALLVSVNPQGLAAAFYTGNIVITISGGAGIITLNLPVSFTVISPGYPVISAVVNAASYASGGLAPGEIVSIAGTLLGPTTPLQLALDSTLKVATALGGVQVLFNGFPAPLTYVSSHQINAVVPYEIAGQPNLFVAVRYQGLTSVAFTTTAASSAPGIFTLNSSGTGPGAILNQDGSVNSPANPTPKGTLVTLFVTGEGLTLPAGVTGKVTTVAATSPITPQPILPVSVTIGGQQVPISFYGEAPGLVSGVMQINARIPLNALSGDLPVEVSVGTNRSQAGVTISVQ